MVLGSQDLTFPYILPPGTLESADYSRNIGTYQYSVSEDGTYSCGVTINGNEEKTSDSATFKFITTDLTTDSTVVSGNAFTITAKATYVTDLANSAILWYKGEEVIGTDVAFRYFQSYILI